MTRKFYGLFFLNVLVIIASLALGAVVMHYFGGGAALVVVILGIGGFGVYSSYVIRRPSKAEVRILSDGIEADATILKVSDTQITLDDLSYVLRLRLRVEPSGGPAFETDLEMPFSRGSAVPVGGKLRVKYDPAKPQQVVMVGDTISVGGLPAAVQESAVPDAAQITELMNQQGLDQVEKAGQSFVYSTEMDPVAASALLQKAEDQMRELHATGHESKAMVVDVHKLGIQVNGNNQGVRIKLTVMPSGIDPYLAEAVGIISERSWPAYQAGQVLRVKVDPVNPLRVSFWKSSLDPA